MLSRHNSSVTVFADRQRKWLWACPDTQALIDRPITSSRALAQTHDDDPRERLECINDIDNKSKLKVLVTTYSTEQSNKDNDEDGTKSARYMTTCANDDGTRRH